MTYDEQLSHPHSGSPLWESGQIWDIAQIQAFLRVSESTAKRFVLEEGFPRPLINKHRNRRWLASDVQNFLFAQSKGELSLVKNTKNLEPKNISYKKSRSAS